MQLKIKLHSLKRAGNFESDLLDHWMTLSDEQLESQVPAVDPAGPIPWYLFLGVIICF